MIDEETPYIDQEEGDGKHGDALAVIGRRVADTCAQAVTDKRWIEELWVDDLRQFRGVKKKGIKHVRNITRPRTRTASARLSDLLFQGGDKNFSVGIDADTPPQAKEQAEAGARFIEGEIETILNTADYESVGRAAIEDACLYGVGIIQGPIKILEQQKSWRQIQDENGAVVNAVVIEDKEQTSIEKVSPWDYFSDLSVADHDDCAYEFRRRYFSKIDMQNLLHRKGFNRQAVYEAIVGKEYSELPWHYTELKGENIPSSQTDFFCIYEVYTTVSQEDIETLSSEHEEESWFGFCHDDKLDPDVECCVWITENGRVLKFAPSLLETGERPFSIFCYDRDEVCFMASPGVPRLIRDEADAATAFWDMTICNADITVAPQMVVNPHVVEPIPDAETKEQDWNIRTNTRGWRLKVAGASAKDAFYFFNIPNQTKTTIDLLEVSKKYADESAMTPEIAQGQQSANMTKTFQGMELLMNSANTVARRIVKDWVDHVTIPLITRIIADVMENKPQLGVFGKFIANVRGANALMLKETQARNAMQLASVAGQNPKFAQMTDWEKLYKQVVYGLQQEPEKVMLTKDEMDKQGENKQPDQEVVKAQMEMQMKQSEIQIRQAELKVKEDTLQLEKYKIDMNYQLEIAKIQAGAQTKQVELAEKNKAKKDEIILNAKAKEHLMAQEFKVESTGEARI